MSGRGRTGADPGRALVLALPSKGRLQQPTLDFLQSCGISVEIGDSRREYVGRLKNVADAEVVFLQADEIATRLDRGTVHIGVTGEDLLREKAERFGFSTTVLMKLGFGKARLVVGIPRSWIDVRSMSDLEEVSLAYRQLHNRRLRVATKYLRLTRGFFTERGIADYRIVESLGATEGAPISGVADIIVDITSTGTTLAANGLKTIDQGMLLSSEVCLVASLGIDWSAEALGALEQILEMVEARERARAMLVVRFHAVPATFERIKSKLIKSYDCELDDTPAAGPATALPANRGEDYQECTLYCPEANLYPVARFLRNADCKAITVTRADYIFGHTAQAFERFRLTQRRLATKT